MARHKSAMKQWRHSVKRQEINKANKTHLRSLVKNTRLLVKNGDLEAAKSSLPKLYSTLDRFSRRQAIHRNAAARLKSRLTKSILSGLAQK